MTELNNRQINHLRNTITKMELIFNAIDEAVIWARFNHHLIMPK